MRLRTTDVPWVHLSMSMEQFTEKLINEIHEITKGSVLSGISQNYIESIVNSAITNICSEKFALKGKVNLEQIPLGSYSASGSYNDPDLGKIVYVQGSNKHKPYQRKWVKPPNPQTTFQQEHRYLFKQSSQQWKNESSTVKEIWNRKAIDSHEFTGQTNYIKHWFRILKSSGIPPEPGFLP